MRENREHNPRIARYGLLIILNKPVMACYFYRTTL